MIKQLVPYNEVILGLSDNGELYLLSETEDTPRWVHLVQSPDDKKKHDYI